MDEHNTKLKTLYKCLMANTSAIWQRAAHTTDQLSSPSCSTGVISRGLTPNKKNRFFSEKVRRIDYQHKNDQIKRARGLCRKTSFLHSNNSSFVPSCEWICLLKVNLKTSQESLNNEINHYFSFKELMTIPFHHLTGQNIGGENEAPLRLALPVWNFGLGWHLGPAGRSGGAWDAKTPRRPPGPHPPLP